MSSEYKDLPAAFPSNFKNTQKVETDYFGHTVYPGETVYNTGMSLRDYFAARAMASIPLSLNDDEQALIAYAAYRQADAMLKARGE